MIDTSMMVKKGARWFMRKGATTSFARGFKNKNDASDYIDSHADFMGRAGFSYWIYGHSSMYEIVDRKGVRAK